MPARHVQGKRAEHQAAGRHLKAGSHILRRGKHAQHVIGMRRHAIGKHPPLHARQQRGELWIVDACRARAIKRNPLHEFEEGGFHVFHVAVAIHVFAIEIGDHGENGRKLEKGAVALIGLGNQVLRFAQTGVRTQRIHPAADHHGWIKPTGGQHGGNHGGGRGLAMHAGHRDAVFEPHELGQHLGSLDDGYLALPRLHHFRVLLVDGGAGHHHPGAHHVAGRMALKNRRAKAAQAVGNAGTAQVGAGNGIAQGQQNFRYAAHPNAPNANEMNALCFCKHGGGG